MYECFLHPATNSDQLSQSKVRMENSEDIRPHVHGGQFNIVTVSQDIHQVSSQLSNPRVRFSRGPLVEHADPRLNYEDYNLNLNTNPDMEYSIFLSETKEKDLGLRFIWRDYLLMCFAKETS